MIGVTALIVSTLSLALYSIERHHIRWSPFVILLIASIIRSLFIPRVPELSDDVYRYLWDGLQVLHGNNPYAHAPITFSSEGDFSAELIEKINHPQLVTIYPPAAQVVFAAGAAFTKSIMGIKMLLSIMDILSCAIVIAILNQLKRPASLSILYAWHPLPVIEVAASGHIDGAGTFFLLIALYCFIRAMKDEATSFCPNFRSPRVFAFLCGGTLAMSALTKLFPFMFLPIFFLPLHKRERWAFGAGITISVLVLTAPFARYLSNFFDTVVVYARDWEFSNVLFRISRDLTSSGAFTRIALWSLFFVVFLLLIANFRLKRKRGNGDRQSMDLESTTLRSTDTSRNIGDLVVRTLYFLILAFLLFNPTLYPWYAVWLVCLFPFFSEPAGIVLSWTIFLSYYVLIDYVYIGRWIENTAFASLIWLGPAAYLIAKKILLRHR